MKDLRKICITYVDEIFCRSDVLNLIKFTSSQDPMLVDDLVPKLISIQDLRKVFVRLIREGVSIKDIVLIFERLSDYVRKYSYSSCAERLRVDLAANICKSNASDKNVLYVIDLSKEWEDFLMGNLDGERFNLDPSVIKNLVETIKVALDDTMKKCAKTPVFVTSPRLRFPLFNLLVKHIPELVVISKAELIADIEIENVAEIKKK